jgi:hypothetical protein
MTQQVVNVGSVAGDGTGDKGQVPFQKTNANFTELYSTGPFSAADSGAVNAYVVTLASLKPAPALAPLLFIGLTLTISAINANTGPSTLNFAGTGAKSIVNASGSAVTGGEIQATQPTTLQYNGTAWQVLSPPTLLQQSATGFFYSQSGARIDRLEDRLFVGDATLNDGQGPTNPVSADWLTQWQLSIGLSGGSVTSSVMGLLTTTPQTAVSAPVGLTAGARTLSATGVLDAIGIQSFGVNNSNFGTSVWGFYAEGHRTNNLVNSAIGIELDVTQRGALVGLNPYLQNFGATYAVQVASGAGQGATVTATFATNVMTVTVVNQPSDTSLILVGNHVSGPGMPANTTISSFGTGTGGTGTYNLSTSPGTLSSRIVTVSNMFDNSAAINIQGNGASFISGINFGFNSITGTDGTSGIPSPAIQFARFHGMFWFASAAIGTAQIYSDASLSVGSPSIQLAQGSVNFRETSSNGLNFQVQLTANAVNYVSAQATASGGGLATLATVGADTNVDLGLFCQGSGLVKFEGASMFLANGAVAMSLGVTGPTGATATPGKWLVFHDATGARFGVPAFAM